LNNTTKGTWGGARPGAGRPRKKYKPFTIPTAAPGSRTPLQWLCLAFRDAGADPELRVMAAGIAIRYEPEDGGVR
jgi:hypothetical protein